jgi:hypothetical protein
LTIQYSADNIGNILHTLCVQKRFLHPADSLRIVIGGNEEGPVIRAVLPPLLGFPKMGCMRLDMAKPDPLPQGTAWTEHVIASAFVDEIASKVRQFSESAN